MPSSPIPSTATIARELERVAAALGKHRISGPKRLALLRRQAALGDLRDAITERARRRLASENARPRDKTT